MIGKTENISTNKKNSNFVWCDNSANSANNEEGFLLWSISDQIEEYFCCWSSPIISSAYTKGGNQLSCIYNNRESQTLFVPSRAITPATLEKSKSH